MKTLKKQIFLFTVLLLFFESLSFLFTGLISWNLQPTNWTSLGMVSFIVLSITSIVTSGILAGTEEK
jgi:hypothetical protein